MLVEVIAQNRQQGHRPSARRRLWLDHSLHLIPATLDANQARAEVNVADPERLDLPTP
jgi:hypothetical protein